MTDASGAPDQDLGKRSRLPMFLGLLLALAGAGGGFYAVQSGMVFGPAGDAVEEQDLLARPEATDIPTFVAIDPIIVSLPLGSGTKLMRFSAELEVNPEHLKEVEALLPRVVDVLNSYLRAIEPADLEQPAALVVLRAQMLRRIQIVTGTGRVRDLLIMEFVLT